VIQKAHFQYPLFLDLNQRAVVVIGGGRVAERKVASLLKAGALVTLVSPDLSSALARQFRNHEIEHISRNYRKGDLDTVSLAFAATNQPEVNRAVAEEGRQKGIWVNVADQAVPGDFIVPATCSEKGLMVAVSSQGKSPARSQKVRDKIKALLLLSDLD